MNAVPSVLEADIGSEILTSVTTRRRRRRRIVVGVVVVAAVAAGVFVVVTRDGKSGDQQTTVVVPTGVATVTKGTLVSRTSVSGTLTYADKLKPINQASGTVTYMPQVGRVIDQGKMFYRVNELPVVFLKGSIPMWRDLARGTSGRDVQQLNAALVSLGYDVDGELEADSEKYNWATASAVRDLQDDLNVKETGKLGKGDVVFIGATKVRVTSVSAQRGTAATAGGSLLEVSATTRQVSADIDATLQDQIKVGQKVRITLPTGKTTDGTVSKVGTVVKKASGGRSTINIRIQPKNAAATGKLDQAPVGVEIITESVENALMVPINALLALLSGGFGIEIVDDAGARKIVPVTLGLFDETAGTVQITGEGVAAGQKVVVPTS